MVTARPDLQALRRTEPSGAGVSIPRPPSRWRTRVLIPVVVIVATAAVLAYASRDMLRPAIAVHVAPVIPSAEAAVGVGTGGADDEIVVDGATGRGAVLSQAPGWIEPAPFAITVPALAEGVVSEVLVLEGEPVSRDQVVVRLVDADARIGLRAADAAIAERIADIGRANAAIAGAEANVAVERSMAATLRDEVDRKRELVAAGGLSAGEFHRMEIRLAGLDARIVAAERQVDEERAAVEQAHAALRAARNAHEAAELVLERMQVRSPVAGVVLSRLVEPGSRISMGARSGEAGGMSSGAVLRIYDPTKLQVRVDVPLADAARIGVGTAAEIVTEALPDQIFSGRVVRVVHEANIQRNTVQFKVSVDDPVATLKPEMLTRVRLLDSAGSRGGEGTTSATSGGGGLLAPTSALVERTDTKAACWLVDATSGAPVARRREIVLAPSAQEGHVIVVSGLRAGDRLVADPPASLREGARLRVVGEHGVHGAVGAGSHGAVEKRP